MIKRFISLTLVVAVFVAAIGQQTIDQKSLPISPRIEADSVYFSLYAPEARTVELVGDFKATMQRGGDGIFRASFSIDRPDMYLYNFVVDGVQTTDPANPYTVRDISRIFSYFIAGDTPYTAGDVPHGSLTSCWYGSRCLGADRRMTVYLPAGYDSRSEHRYPVLYLLHGMGGDETAWSDLGRAAYILDNMTARGEIEPMIVVMPNGNAAMKAAPGETELGLYMPEGNHSVAPADTFEKSFEEIIDYVDTHYNTLREPSARAVAGLSMGGGQTWRIQQLMPHKVDYYGIFSGAVGWKGSPESMKESKAWLPAEPMPKLYYIAIGRDDFLYPLNSNFRSKLDDAGVAYEYVESDGGHTWANWRRYLVDFLPRLFK